MREPMPRFPLPDAPCEQAVRACVNARQAPPTARTPRTKRPPLHKEAVAAVYIGDSLFGVKQRAAHRAEVIHALAYVADFDPVV